MHKTEKAQAKNYHKNASPRNASKVFVQKLKTPRSSNKKSGMLQTNSPNSSQPAQEKGKTLEENDVPSKAKSPVEKALSPEMPYPNGTTNEAKDGYEDEFFEADEEAESLGEEEMDTTKDDPDWVAPAALMKGKTQTVESDSDSLSSISNGGGEVTNSVRGDNSKEPIEQPTPQHHEDQKSYVCRQCPTTFPNRSGFRVHLKAVHRVNKRFQCPHCSKAFRISFRLSEHVKMMHEGERKYCCRFCDGKFFVKSHLTRHVNIYHTNGTAVRCPQCYKVFRSEEKMKEHVLKEHAVVSAFACRYCDSSFQTWEECIEHGKKVHPDQPNASADYNDLQCRACGSAFDSLGDLRRHENTCTRVSRAITGSVDRFCCKECGMLFVLASSLRTHLSSVHGINPTEAEKVLKDLKGMPCFLCPFCHKTYTELRSLRRHLAESHLEDTGETDVTPEQLEDMENIGDGLIFECKHCGNVYSSRANLRKHELLTHAVEGDAHADSSVAELVDITVV
nr:unnamed protein product [Spirometra erinaceieuropaei]